MLTLEDYEELNPTCEVVHEANRDQVARVVRKEGAFKGCAEYVFERR